MRPPLSRDPGLQPERTSLSWTRTASGLLLNGVLNLRVGYASESLPLLGLSCMLLIAAAATFGFGRQRRLVLTTGRSVAPVSASAARAVMAACVLAALTGFGSISVGHALGG
ncbi:DUF202 domain-containing protein [Variovorax terrae]|uniref:DUF202 domain-containing protein n=1 Tax=Variovorax terrae TaxID=2923278 RepID=UPI003C6EE0FC